MFTKKATENPELLKRIDEVLEELSQYAAVDDSYATIVARLEELYALKETLPEPISPNTLITAGASLSGILLIVLFERNNIVTSKALSFIKFK